jgi:vacuolar-type H+-ATPase subunit C/Vma6
MIEIVDLAPIKIGDFLKSYYYLRFEVTNLKRIFRGLYSGIPASSITNSLIPIKPYRVNSYNQIIDLGDYKNAIQLIRDTLYSSLVLALELSEKYDALWPIEMELNLIYAKTIFKSLENLNRNDRDLVRKIVQLEIDVENFLIAVKQRGSKKKVLGVEDLFPITYGIDHDLLEEVMSSVDIKSVIKKLSVPYNDILSPLYEGDVALIRSRLRSQIFSLVNKGRAKNDYGFNVIMAYLIFSEIEKDDLVGIAWGKTQKITSEDILKYLVIPNLS